MTTEPMTIDNPPQSQLQEWQTPVQIRAQVNRIQSVMQDVMKEGTHYGIIPGCKQPSLYKAGAEKLLATFRLAAEPEVEDLSGPDERRYRVTVRLVSPSGINLGAGIGECSTNEEKYKWRAAVCEEEFNATEEDRRRVKWSKGYYDKKTRTQEAARSVKQVRTNPEDLANTALKMAKKRGLIDVCLTVLAASDCFTQDIEDLPEGYDMQGNPVDEGNGAPPPPPKSKRKADDTAKNTKPAAGAPQETQAATPEQGREGATPRNATAGAITTNQKRLLNVKASQAGVSEKALLDQAGVQAIDDIPASQVNELLKWLQDGAQ